MAKRLQAMGNPRYANGFAVTLHRDMLEMPLVWRQPKLVFVNSMSDLFHESVPIDFIQAVFATMEKAGRHTFQVLTKRADRLAEFAPRLSWPRNVWMGVTVESQDNAWRVDDLKKVPAAVRFLSCEPLIGSVQLDLQGIHWVIVGGESGPGARPMELDWARSLRAQCTNAGVPYFLKQLGGVIDKRGHDKAVLDGVRWIGTPTQRTISPAPVATVRT
jgi:protein gp37